MSRLGETFSTKKSNYTTTEQRKIRNELKIRSIKGLIKLARENGKIKDTDTYEEQKKKALNYSARLYNDKIEIKNRKIIKDRKDKKKMNDFISKINRDLQKDGFIKRKHLGKERGKKLMENFKSKKGFYQLKAGNKFYALNTDTILRLTEKFESLFTDEFIAENESDKEIIDIITGDGTIEIKELKMKTGNYKSPTGGGFFKYTHKINADLTPLQIYKEINSENYTMNCFVNCIEQSGKFTDEEINYIKLTMKSHSVRTNQITDFCKKFNCLISIQSLNNDEGRTERVRHYGDKNSDRKLEIGLLDNHYFPKMYIDITKYAIENWDNIKHLKNPHIIYGFNNKGSPKRDVKKKIKSFLLVKLLLEEKEKYLIPIEKCDEIYKTPYYEQTNIITNLDYMDENINYEVKRTKEKDLIPNIFFDTETKPFGIHKAFLMRMAYRNENGIIIKRQFMGENCGMKMLFWISVNVKYNENGIKLLAHNLGYDFRFIGKYVKIKSLLENGSMMLGGDCKFYMNKKKPTLNIKLQDSYALIPEKLSKFADMFNCKSEKEFIPYKMYNDVNVEKRFIELTICYDYCEKQTLSNNIEKGTTIKDMKDDKKLFLENCKRWRCIHNDKVDIVQYMNKYCEIDVDLLLVGYETFKQMIYEATKLNLDNYITISQLAQDYYKSQKCYDDVGELAGVPREYIQKCMVGGRVMPAFNEKQYVIGKIQDNDAVSLYSSAMCRLGGILKGSPKVLQNKTYEFLEKCDGYFTQIKILKVNKLRPRFPLMSRIDENGSRLWTDDMVNYNMYVDKTTLEDLINFQQIEFEIIDGYYYDEGRNENLEPTTRHLFNERLKQKKNKNKIEKIYKLIMNSCYGKNLIKPHEDDVKFIVGKENMEDKLIRNYNNHQETISYDFGEEQDDKYKTYKMKIKKPINEHFNYAPAGVEILSMSKRIMNEVMCLADDNDIPIYYQDTDSMHIDDESVDKLAILFKKKYNRELIGKGLGQFHNDFDSNICDGKSIHSKMFIALGKKVYMDKLTDDNGNVDYHIRMKGVSGKSVKFHSRVDDLEIEELYGKLYKGDAYAFDLACNGNACCFDGKRNGTIETKEQFYRIICFDKDKESKKRKIDEMKETLKGNVI